MRPRILTLVLAVTAGALAAWFVPRGRSRSGAPSRSGPAIVTDVDPISRNADPSAPGGRKALREPAGEESRGGEPRPQVVEGQPYVTTATIQGFVRDADSGGPIPRFGIFERVTGDPEELPSGPSREHRLHRFTSWDGSFARANLTPGSHDLLFVAEGYVSRVFLCVGTDGASLEVLLTREAILRGIVLEEGTGAPVASATVSAVDPESWHWPRIGVDSFDARTTTSVEGRFELRGLGPGRLRLKVHHPSFVDATAEPIDLRPGLAVEGLVVPMSRGGAIEGTVGHEDRSPLVGLEVEAFPALGPWDRRKDTSDAEGRFFIKGLRAGLYRVYAYTGRSWGSYPTADVLIEEGRTARVDLVSPPPGGCTVRGRVLRGGHPVDHAEVHLDRTEGSGSWAWLPPACWESETDADGEFRLEGVPSGSATLSIAVGSADPAIWNYGSASDLRLVVPATSECRFDVELPSGEITGRVVRDLDGSPVQGAEIRVFRREGGGWMWKGSAQTREDGSYRIQGLDAGDHLAVAKRDGDSFEGTATLGRGSRRSFAVSEGEVARVDLALRPLGSVVVHVIGPDGLPVSRAEVHLVTADHPPPCIFGPDAPETTEPGVYRSDEISEGRYSIVVCTAGLAAVATEEKTIRAAEETTCRIDLSPGTLVRVKGLDLDGSVVMLHQVAFADEKGRLFFASPSPSGNSAALTLAPGGYQLTVGGGWKQRTLPVTVGTTPQEIVVTLEAGTAPW